MIRRLISFLIIAGVLFYLYAAYLGIKGLDTHEYTIDSEKILTTYNGFTIAHFSDLLYGSTINIDEVKELVNKINAYKPDIIVFTGNLISDKAKLTEDDINELGNALKELKCEQNKYSITSELDKKNIDTVKIILDNADFKNLDNKNELIFKKDYTPIQISGITDFSNITEVLKNDTPAFYQIVLIHKSDDANKLVNYDIDTIFAGNSLGGLIKIPFFGGVLKQPGSEAYLEGKYTLTSSMNLYVSTGLGTNNLHYRAFNKPSFNIYKLYNKANAD